MDNVSAIEDAVDLLREDEYREAYEKLIPVIDNCVKRALGKLGLCFENDQIAHDLQQEARLYWFERLRKGKIDPSVDPPQITQLLSLSTYSFIKREYYDEESGPVISTEDVERDRDISEVEDVEIPDSLKSFDDYEVENDIDKKKLTDSKKNIQSWLTLMKRNLGVTDQLNYLSDLARLMVHRHYYLTEGEVLEIGGI